MIELINKGVYLLDGEKIVMYAEGMPSADEER